MSEKSIWSEFPEAYVTHNYHGFMFEYYNYAQINDWRSEAEAEWNALLQNYKLADFAARKAQGKLKECQNSMYDFVMQHRDDIELHMEDYELLEPILRQILESVQPKEEASP